MSFKPNASFHPELDNIFSSVLTNIVNKFSNDAPSVASRNGLSRTGNSAVSYFDSFFAGVNGSRAIVGNYAGYASVLEVGRDRFTVTPKNWFPRTLPSDGRGFYATYGIYGDRTDSLVDARASANYAGRPHLFFPIDGRAILTSKSVSPGPISPRFVCRDAVIGAMVGSGVRITAKTFTYKNQ